MFLGQFDVEKLLERELQIAEQAKKVGTETAQAIDKTVQQLNIPPSLLFLGVGLGFFALMLYVKRRL